MLKSPAITAHLSVSFFTEEKLYECSQYGKEFTPPPDFKSSQEAPQEGLPLSQTAVHLGETCGGLGGHTDF